MTSLTESLREVQNDIREYFEVGDTTLYAAVTALMNIKLELDTIITTLEQPTNDVEPKYAHLSCPEFLEAVGVDGQKWADAFMEMWGSKLHEVDHALMVGWFCNALMTMHDHIHKPIHNGDHAQYLLDKAALKPCTNDVERVADALHAKLYYLGQWGAEVRPPLIKRQDLLDLAKAAIATLTPRVDDVERVREAFEKWCVGRHSIRRTDTGFYVHNCTDFAWNAWQAALTQKHDTPESEGK